MKKPDIYMWISIIFFGIFILPVMITKAVWCFAKLLVSPEGQAVMLITFALLFAAVFIIGMVSVYSSFK